MKEHKRLGRPIGSVNKNKETQALVIPQELFLKIKTLADKTGVGADRIALGSLVDGLKNWEGIHEHLINYNESIEKLIRESGSVPTRKHRRAAPKTVSVKKSERHAASMEDALRLHDQARAAQGDNGQDQFSTGAEDLSPYGNAIFGRGESQQGPGIASDLEQLAHGE